MDPEGLIHAPSDSPESYVFHEDLDLDSVADKAAALAAVTRSLSIIPRIEQVVVHDATSLAHNPNATKSRSQDLACMSTQRTTRATDLSSELERIQLLRACMSFARDFETFEQGYGVESKKDQLLRAITSGEQVSIQRVRKYLREFGAMLNSTKGQSRAATMKSLDCAIRIGIKLQLLDHLGEKVGGLGRNGFSLLIGFDYTAFKRLPYTMLYYIVKEMTSNVTFWTKAHQFNQQYGGWWSATLDHYHDKHRLPGLEQITHTDFYHKGSKTTTNPSPSSIQRRKTKGVKPRPASTRASRARPTFKCEIPGCCGRNFATKGNYRRHLRERTGMCRTVCPYCQKSFARKSGRDAHLANDRCHSIFQQESRVDYASMVSSPSVPPLEASVSDFRAAKDVDSPVREVNTGLAERNEFPFPLQATSTEKQQTQGLLGFGSTAGYDISTWVQGVEHPALDHGDELSAWILPSYSSDKTPMSLFPAYAEIAYGIEDLPGFCQNDYVVSNALEPVPDGGMLPNHSLTNSTSLQQDFMLRGAIGS